MRKNLQILFILIIIVSSCKKEEEIVGVGGVKGSIKNEFGQPIEGALIKIESFSTKSNSFGEYSFDRLKVKEYSVQVSKENFITKIEPVTIIANKLIELDFILSAGEPYLEISDSILTVNSSASYRSITVTSNADWIISNSSTWLISSKKTGQGNETLSISCKANQELTERKDTIEFQSGNLIRNLVIVQSAPIKLINFEGIIGNGEKNITDSVYIRFNKPIEVNSIQSNWEYCLSDIKYNLTDNNSSVKFTFSCAELGGNYPFTISVSDGSGNSFSQKIEVPFYKRRLTIEGLITDYLFLKNDKEIVIATFSPSKLIWYSIEHDSIIQTYNLSGHISPINISYNPYDSKIYIMGSHPQAEYRHTTINRPDIYTIDLKTSEIVKAITIFPDSEDHPDSPANIPFNIGFTKSGYGIVLLKSNGSSALRWKLIDSKSNLIYKYPSIISNADYFDNVQMNFDQTKLILTQTYVGSCDYGIFDGNTQSVSILRPSSITRSIFITPNKKNEKIYFGQLYDQFIMDLAGNISKISYLDNRSNGSADFSYRENEDNIIYFCDEDYLRVMDYNNGQTLMWCDIIYGLNKFSSTTDGKYAIAYKQNSDISSSLYVFDTNVFTNN